MMNYASAVPPSPDSVTSHEERRETKGRNDSDYVRCVGVVGRDREPWNLGTKEHNIVGHNIITYHMVDV